jgi:hypothetical protein
VDFGFWMVIEGTLEAAQVAIACRYEYFLD